MDYKIVIAIDFGTSRSGYAYGWADDGDVKYHDSWPGQQVAYAKTLTHLLYGPDLAVENWGFEAPVAYKSLRHKQQADDHFYFHGFKMQLVEGENRGGTDGPYMVKRKHSFLVIDLIADYIRKIRDLALQKIEESITVKLRDSEIRWCLTVPAIWNDSLKDLMRRAAVKANLIQADEIDGERLLLALEPEAAALYCQQRERLSLLPGTCFMVVDCGGGTIDITTHQVTEGLYLREMGVGTGGAFGATYVDRAFRRYLVDRLSVDVVERWEEDEPIEFHNFMLEDWERAKCAFDPAAGGTTEIPLRPRLHRILKKHFPAVLDGLAEGQEGEDGYLYLKREEMIALFAESLDGVISCIEEQVSSLRGEPCDYMFLVGGFSTAALLRQRVGERFGSQMKIVMPPNPGAAIMGGAVHFGLDPTVIRARRARLTYGISCSFPFVEGVDPGSKKFWEIHRQAWYCRDRVLIFVMAGDVIEENAVVKGYLSIFDPQETSCSTAIVSCLRPDIRYSDEPGVTKQVELAINTPKVGLKDRQVEYEMFFGKSEIQVQAKDLSSDEKSNVSCRLSFVYSPELLGGSSHGR